MKFWHFCRTLTLGLALLLLTAGCGQPAITFVHMTDPQIGFRDTTAEFGQSDTLMQRAVAAANALKRKGCVFLGIDTNCIKENDAEAEEAQWAWLEEELARAHARRARHIFLFLHCPIVREALDEPGINVVRVSRKGIEVTFVPTSDKEQ